MCPYMYLQRRASTRTCSSAHYARSLYVSLICVLICTCPLTYTASSEHSYMLISTLCKVLICVHTYMLICVCPLYVSLYVSWYVYMLISTLCKVLICVPYMCPYMCVSLVCVLICVLVCAHAHEHITQSPYMCALYVPHICVCVPCMCMCPSMSLHSHMLMRTLRKALICVSYMCPYMCPCMCPLYAYRQRRSR